MNVINKKSTLLFALMLFVGALTQAQEIIKHSVKTKPQKQQYGKKKKIDGIIATVGEYIVLDSDIDKSFIELFFKALQLKILPDAKC